MRILVPLSILVLCGHVMAAAGAPVLACGMCAVLMLLAAYLVARHGSARLAARIAWTALAIGSCALAWARFTASDARLTLFHHRGGMTLAVWCATFVLLVQILSRLPVAASRRREGNRGDCGPAMPGDPPGSPQ